MNQSSAIAPPVEFTQPEQVYLGQGIYAEHDTMTDNILLRLHSQDSSPLIAMCPATIRAFTGYAERRGLM